MNEASLASRRREEIPATPLVTPPTPLEIPQKKIAIKSLPELTREELLVEALYDAHDPNDRSLDTVNDDQLRQEVRWRRAATLRKPALTALALLLSKVSGETFEALSRGDISAAQLIEKANSFVSGRNGVKILKLPDRVEDHERRLNNLESSSV